MNERWIVLLHRPPFLFHCFSKPSLAADFRPGSPKSCGISSRPAAGLFAARQCTHVWLRRAAARSGRQVDPLPVNGHVDEARARGRQP